jgi:hypothetical protein
VDGARELLLLDEGLAKGRGRHAVLSCPRLVQEHHLQRLGPALCGNTPAFLQGHGLGSHECACATRKDGRGRDALARCRHPSVFVCQVTTFRSIFCRRRTDALFPCASVHGVQQETNVKGFVFMFPVVKLRPETRHGNKKIQRGASFSNFKNLFLNFPQNPGSPNVVVSR